MIMTLNASTRKTDIGLQAEAESKGFKVILDEPKDMGGAKIDSGDGSGYQF